jgi:hypothetical protein
LLLYKRRLVFGFDQGELLPISSAILTCRENGGFVWAVNEAKDGFGIGSLGTLVIAWSKISSSARCENGVPDPLWGEKIWPEISRLQGVFPERNAQGIPACRRG